MSYYWFNTSPVELGQQVSLTTYQENLIEAIPNLRRASLGNACLFGGPLLRQLLASAPIVGDRPYVFVDTKVSMLMPGWWPAIPGWHTDGVPRFKDGAPNEHGKPSLPAQMDAHMDGYFPRYHTMHVGNDCATEFLDGQVRMQIQHDEDEDMYSEMTLRVNACETMRKLKAPLGQWMSWDWWNVHQATQATERGWRLLIRITESNRSHDHEDFIRAQNQVYVPREFGW